MFDSGWFSASAFPRGVVRLEFANISTAAGEHCSIDGNLPEYRDVPCCLLMTCMLHKGKYLSSATAFAALNGSVQMLFVHSAYDPLNLQLTLGNVYSLAENNQLGFHT